MKKSQASYIPHPGASENLSSFRHRGGQSAPSLVKALGCASVLILLYAATAMASPAAAKFKHLVSVDVKNGIVPLGVVQGLDGNLYGTTNQGGANLTCNQVGSGCGEVFKMTPAGDLTVLYSFCSKKNSKANCTDGAYPQAPLLLAKNGNFYGTTGQGGLYGGGTVFEITPAGKMTVIHNFCSRHGCTDGVNPAAPLIQAKDGNFYGTTDGNENLDGNIFKITPAGKLTTLYYGLPGGWAESGLVQATDGNFYGTTAGRSGYSDGDIFKITPSRKMTILYNFCQQSNCTDGAFPYGSLVQGPDGDLYGTASGGGAYGFGEVYKIPLAGGKPTVLHSFDYETVGNLGADPTAGLVLATDGNFYGTTSLGGKGCVSGCGTIFKMTPAGKMTTLHQFSGPDGTNPQALFQDTSGTFFGVTSSGGNTTCPGGCGTIYSLSVGIKPFVSLLPNYGNDGATIDILGQGFSGATGVSFDGVAAKYDNVADTYMTAVVPTGALTGTVTVSTFTATYKSSQIFLVTPQLKTFTKSGVVGSTVTLTGVSLTQTTGVTIGGKSATFKVVSDTKVTATVPALAKTGENIVVTTLGGSASIGPFAIQPNPLSFSPTNGSVGTEVKISGTTFTHASKVTFGSVPATSFGVTDDSHIDATVPKGAKTGPIEVTTPGGTGTSKGIFTVTQ
jgi:uncharacterized repeat protein (TIGR03803 family)